LTTPVKIKNFPQIVGQAIPALITFPSSPKLQPILPNNNNFLQPTMMRSTTLLFFTLGLLFISQIPQSQGLALIALASRPSLLGRFASRVMEPSVAPAVPMVEESKPSAHVPQLQVDTSGFDADAYRREMINLVYSRSVDRLVN
jgi:hypothetical protein